MIINISAGHNPDGKIACGAVGIVKESVINREIKNRVIEILRNNGHTVYDCTEDNGTSQNDVLVKVVNKDNAHKADATFQIHLNAGKGLGVECYVYDNNNPYASNICNEISKLGYKNRGVKSGKDLYFVRKTKAVATLIECFFCDTQSDVDLYNCEYMSRAIARGIVGSIKEDSTSTQAQPTQPQTQPVQTTQATQAIPNLSAYKGNSIVDGLRQCGYDSSFNYRESLWKLVGNTDTYTGSACQNVALLNVLKGVTNSTQTAPQQSTQFAVPSLKGYKGFSIVDGLKQFGYDSSFEYRKKIWTALGKGGTYKGTSSQNTTMLNLLKAR